MFKKNFLITLNEYVKLKQVNHAIINLKAKKYSGLTPKQFLKGVNSVQF